MFRYLLSVRRVQSQLQHCWALQMQRKHLTSTQTDAVKWRLRNHMAFLIDNLQYYLQVGAYLSHALTQHSPGGGSPLLPTQVDVLESQFSQLLQLINSTRDFESIRLAHDHFLSNLLAQSFILLKPVSPPTRHPRCWGRPDQVSPTHPGLPLPERDPGAVSDLLLSGQSEHGVSGREGDGSAGPAGQGGALGYV